MNAPFKIAIRRLDDGFVHAYVEHLIGKTIGERQEISTISVPLAEDPETFKQWQDLLKRHLERLLAQIGIEPPAVWKNFTLPQKN